MQDGGNTVFIGASKSAGWGGLSIRLLRSGEGISFRSAQERGRGKHESDGSPGATLTATRRRTAAAIG